MTRAAVFAAFLVRLLCGLLPVHCIAAESSDRNHGGPVIAFSFDDGLDPAHNPQAAAWNARMLAALKAAGVKAILYPTGHLVGSPDGLALVRAWGEAGHAIGNHSWSHRNLGGKDMTLDDFIADAARNQTLLQDLPGWQPRFRFPYLKQGDTAAKRDGFRRWLDDRHYASGEVSVDASDWYYSQRYTRWRRTHPDADNRAFRDAYLTHLLDRARYYDGLSKQLLGRSARHVILLHTNLINATFLPDVIAMFRQQGWRIVTPDEAYADPLYAMRPEVLPAGESILWSLAKAKGIEGLRYPAEDSVYEKAALDAIDP